MPAGIRCFITTDKDFFHTIPLAFARHHGAMSLPCAGRIATELLRRLAGALAALGERKMDDSVWLVTDTRIYSRQKS